MKFKIGTAWPIDLFPILAILLLFGNYFQQTDPFIFSFALSINKSLRTSDGNVGRNDTIQKDLIEDLTKKSTLLPNTRNRSCQFNKTTRLLFCNGSLDLDYFRLIRNERIQDLIVDNYLGEPFCSSPLKTSAEYQMPEKCFLKVPEAYRKIAGQLQLKNTGLRINFILNMTPMKRRYFEYEVEGEAFSTKFVKISASLKGGLTFNFPNGFFVVSIAVETTDPSTRRWILRSNLTLVQSDVEKDFDDWMARGIVRSDFIAENHTSYFSGIVKTKLVREECKFFGEINLQNGNLLWSVGGKVSTKLNKRITIPRAAFSNMTIKNVIFRNSNFFNNFDSDVFEGLKGVESISFLNSRLEVMPKLNRLLQNMKDLKELHIEDCTTPGLKFGIESRTSLKNLKKISFKETGPLNFHEYSFFWLRNANVTYLNLRNSYIVWSQNDRSTLSGISHSLKYLDISYSNLNSETDLAVILKDLKLVNLTAEGLKLKKIPTVALTSLKYTLKYLSLRGSNFEKTLEKNIFKAIFDFPLLTQLSELDLRDCHINYLERGAFDRLPNLKILHLANNNLENLQDGWLLSRPHITRLDLSSNRRNQQIMYVGNAANTSLDLSIFSRLQVLNLTNGLFANPENVIKSLGGSLRELYLGNTNLKNLPLGIFDKMTNLEVLDLSLNKNLNSAHTFSINFFINLKRLRTLNLGGCRINTAFIYRSQVEETVKLTQDNGNDTLETLENLEILDLSSNNIIKIDSAMFSIFPNLKVLKLCANGITTWDSGTFNFSKHLESVYLNENKIEVITATMKRDLMKLKFFKLGNNPFICGPYVYDLIEIINNDTPFNGYLKNSSKLSKQPKKLKAILDWSESNYICFSKSKGKFVSFTSVEEAFDESLDDENLVSGVQKNVYLWVIMAVLIGIVFTIAIFCWKVLDIHLITKVVRNAVALSFLSHKIKEPEKYDYNVFVSYSDKDREWVIEELIPRLQSINEIKVCLHERDFQVGLSILENIIASIDSSRNIMLVLSTAFLKSHWCQYEMHLAQHRLLEKGRDQLILILLEDIPLIKRPRSLRYLMMTKTYLEWPVKPKNPNDVEVFWSRLLKALKI